MSWIRRNWRYLLLAVALLGGGVLLLWYFTTRNKEEAERLRAQLMLEGARTKVKGLQADRKARAEELRTNQAEAAAIRKEIADTKRKALAKVKEVDHMSDVEVAIAFKRLGY